MRVVAAAAVAAHVVAAAAAWSPPSMPVTARWADPEGRDNWYSQGKSYWAATSASNTGMLGGYQAVHAADVADSVKFIQPHWPLENAPRVTRALDVGAGIGRVSGGLLLELCDTVDLVEGCAKFVEQAREDLGWAAPRMERFIVADMQAFEPEPGRYHLVWIQWCIGQLTDDDLVSFLVRCKAALAPGGLIVIKDNVLDRRSALADGLELDSQRFLVDEDDKSVIRTRDHLNAVLGRTGLEVLAARDAELGRTDLHPVVNMALR